MQKLISMRYRGKCRKCRQEIPAGARAYWYGHRQGVSHYPDCSEKPKPEPTPIPDKPRDLPKDSMTLEYSEVVETYRNPATPFPVNSSEVNRYREDWKRGRAGGTTGESCTTADMLEWISSGYHVPGMTNPPGDLMPTRKRRRLLFQEEGELQLDLAFSGYDYPFASWEKRERKPGMRVNVQMNFAWVVPQTVIAEYQRWVARLLYTLEEIGYDLEVNASMVCENLWRGSGKQSLNIRVKRENEASDFANWSAMFSPGGLRHLFFLAVFIANEKRGERTPPGIGRNDMSAPWTLEFDSDSRTLYIRNGQGQSSFPEAEMTEKFTRLMESLK